MGLPARQLADSASDHLPRDAETFAALAPTEQPGYYPGFSTLEQQNFWDAATREKVLKRVHQVPPLRFFSESQATLMQAVLDRVIPQDDRVPERRIPVLNLIDERLYLRKFDGYIYEDMPEEDVAHRLGLQAIEAMALENKGRSFVALSHREQDEILKSIHDGKPCGAHAIWKKMSPTHYWHLLVQDAASAYYAHPWAWDEIGFGGPSYPRGYIRRTNGEPEPWEKREQRYEWLAPPDSLSGETQANPKLVTGRKSHGEAGTH